MANDQGTLLAYRNWVEEVDNNGITTDAVEQGARVVANLKTRESDDFWRFAVAPGATSRYVTVDFGVDREVGVVTVQFPRSTYPGVSEAYPAFGGNDTIRVQLANEANEVVWDSTAVVAAPVPGYMTWYTEVDPSVTARKMVVIFNAGSRVTAGFCDVACLGAWPVIAPNIGFSYPAGFGWVLNNESGRTPAGRLYAARFDPIRRWSLAFEALSRSEALTIDEMIRYAGGARQVFVKRGDLPVGRDAMLAVVTAQRDTESRTATLLQQALSFEEFI